MNVYWHMNERVPGYQSYCLTTENEMDGCLIHLDGYFGLKEGNNLCFKESEHSRVYITREEFDWMLAHPEEVYAEILL